MPQERESDNAILCFTHDLHQKKNYPNKINQPPKERILCVLFIFRINVDNNNSSSQRRRNVFLLQRILYTKYEHTEISLQYERHQLNRILFAFFRFTSFDLNVETFAKCFDAQFGAFIFFSSQYLCVLLLFFFTSGDYYIAACVLFFSLSFSMSYSRGSVRVRVDLCIWRKFVIWFMISVLFLHLIYSTFIAEFVSAQQLKITN